MSIAPPLHKAVRKNQKTTPPSSRVPSRCGAGGRATGSDSHDRSTALIGLFWSEAMGEGCTDFLAIGKALHEVHFSGVAVIELAHEGGFKPTRPLRESLIISRGFVRQTLGY